MNEQKRKFWIKLTAIIMAASMIASTAYTLIASLIAGNG